ncbi:MAG: methyl-accepting chemotaxis sensory transducer [Ignavibacteria bacterium]|nr:MAG: methyl-accepting chemotaxis sensory transducer [Ignavibacteria bacterium]KAF0160736.1 MAG: methyl-accepting chemotaxis sensory transducer [Ignavibacteria bacterium]
MNWFLNKSIRTKLLSGFIFLALLTALVSIIGWLGLNAAEVSVDKLYKNKLLAIANMATTRGSLLTAGLNVEKAILTDDQAKREAHISTAQTFLKKGEEAWKSYTSSVLTDEEKEVITKFDKAYKAYKSELETGLSFLTMGAVEEAKVMNQGSIEENQKDWLEALSSLFEINKGLAQETMDTIYNEANASIMNLLIIAIVSVMAAIGLGYLLAKKIGDPIKKLAATADRLALGDVDIEINSKTTDEIGNLEKSFAAMIEGIKEKVAVAEKIASGDITVKVDIKSEEDSLSKSLHKVTETIKQLVDGLTSLSKKHAEGNLEARGKAELYSGGFKEIVNGVNASIEVITAPLVESNEVLNKIASGDLTVRMSGDYKGDLQNIKDNINHLAESFNNALSDVSAAVQATASASAQISSSAEEMAAGAQEQSAQTAEVASAVDEMTKTIMDTTQNASAASGTAKNAGNIAKEGGKVVGQTIEGMNRIAVVVKQSADTVQQLGKSSDQIGEIVQVIDDIADQTNLLALNAAIEAARAGEQGRGFAVVADEVRKLAERTTKATKEIANMIKQIQKDTSEAVISMTSGTVEVEKGKELADEAGKSLSQIISGAEQVVDIVTQVAAASEEQSSAAEQISKNLESINHVTNESATGIQQIARASEDLNRLTLNLQELISRFKISNSLNHDSLHSNQLTVRSNRKLMHH